MAGGRDIQRELAAAIEADLAASDLGRWMQQHRTALGALFSDDVPWQTVADHCRIAGLLTRPDPDVVRQTWQAVQQLREARPANKPR